VAEDAGQGQIKRIEGEEDRDQQRTPAAKERAAPPIGQPDRGDGDQNARQT